MMTLVELYKNHKGKVSDKWALYLSEYDRVFSPYREQEISVLEIGIQNGGSLEIWSKYFPNAKKFVGCDINPDCSSLNYEDPRIRVVVGDAGTVDVREQVLRESSSFDLIIEDGSHDSRDIVKAFMVYFPVLSDGGVFVAEDLHCSYWQEYEGGLFYPYSAVSFFKLLADVVNFEHWGISRSRSELLSGFYDVYQDAISDEVLSQIHSIEFVNSLCIVKKSTPRVNRLGERVITGNEEKVEPGRLSVAGTDSAVLDQTSNYWATMVRPPAENYQSKLDEIEAGRMRWELEKAKTERLQQTNRDLQAEAERLQQTNRDLQAEAERLQQTNRDLQAEAERLGQVVAAMHASRSWRYTEMLRNAGTVARFTTSLAKRLRQLSRQNGGYVGLIRKTSSITHREGLYGVLRRVNEAQQRALDSSGELFDRNDYQAWIKLYDTLDEDDIQTMKKQMEAFTVKPKISVLMPVFNAPLDLLEKAIRSVQNQIYDNWELCIADDASTDRSVRPLLESYARHDSRIKVLFRKSNGHISAASNSALGLATGDFIALMDQDDLLAEHALYWVIDAVNQMPNAALIYSDEDKVTVDGVRYDPYFKCEFNYELFLAQNMISHLGVYRLDIIRDIGGFREGVEGAQDYDLALRVIEKIDKSRIVHVPRVLYHWRAMPGSTALNIKEKNYAAPAALNAVESHLMRIGTSAEVCAVNGIPFQRVRYSLPTPNPLVSILIPTRDQANLLEQCIESIKSKSTWNAYEIIVIDNGSVEKETFRLFDRIQSERIRIIRDDSPFNYSALNNRAAVKAHGEVLCFLNNDIEVITPGWMEEMLGFVTRPDIGVVGARLWYPDFRLQHGGVILGIGGVAGHSHKFAPRNSLGYYCRALLHQQLSAVTGACMMIKSSVFEDVGGLDEGLGVAFNDIDFCLRVSDSGYRNIWTPYAELFHHESVSRGMENTPEKQSRFADEVQFMKERWGDRLLSDPLYSPNLTLDYEDFSYAWPPRVMKCSGAPLPKIRTAG